MRKICICVCIFTVLVVNVISGCVSASSYRCLQKIYIENDTDRCVSVIFRSYRGLWGVKEEIKKRLYPGEKCTFGYFPRHRVRGKYIQINGCSHKVRTGQQCVVSGCFLHSCDAFDWFDGKS